MRRLALLLGLTALLGCGENLTLPGITVAIVTDAGAEFDSVIVEASRGSKNYEGTFATEQLPGTVFLGCDESNLGPSYCASRTVDIRVAALQGATQVRIERTAQLSYAGDGSNRLLHMPLCGSCLNVTCNEGLTCVRGACVAPQVAVNDLNVDDPSLSLDSGECEQTKCTGTCIDGCGTCPDNPTISIGTGGAAFDIDQHEVTRDEYAAFLAADVGFDDQIEACSWNRDYAPSTDPDPDMTGCMERSEVCQGEGCGNHPQVCVDWCDAKAYCAWRGMRLCGARGGGGVDIEMRDDPTVSQWFAACSAEATMGFPYGDAHVPQQCNDSMAELDTTIAVGTSPACVTATGAFDLSGNVSEWTDSCSENGSNVRLQECVVRGGSYSSVAQVLSCSYSDDGNYDTTRDRDHVSAQVGFRCCSL